MKLSKEFKVGLFMVVSISLLYVGFQFLKGIDFFSTTHKYYVVYQDVDKLTESNQIFLNGLAVGRVSDIEIQQSRNRVIVQLDIESNIVLTDSTRALLDGELLGGRFIDLDVRRGTRKLNPKDTILAEVSKGIMDFAGPVATTLQTTLQNLNVVLGNLARNTNRLDTMFIRLQATPGLLNRTLITANTNIGELGSTVKGVANNLNGTLDQLKPTLANFKTLSDSLKMIQINGTLNRANQSLTKLNETLSRLNKGDNTLSKLMTEDTLYTNLNKLLLSVDSLAKHFNKNPKHFLAPLGKSQKQIERDLQKEKEKANAKK
ncbi:MlaD family protein [Chryseolinea lacunae]|uniref:MCE family protein n=1 Tax=Chryseolinea lacunae TaxID=2801331 RepID=A0ABS1KX26_9BACT|nr:MlaD family protein [Chryseolinea lacunae]MBL0743242.1 MCE family protein [Chryseolinea lacunae]